MVLPITVSYGSMVGSANDFNSRANFLSNFAGRCTNLPRIDCVTNRRGRKKRKKKTALYIFVHAGEECPIILTNSYVLRNRPSTASSVMTTVPPSTPMPPHVPIRMNTGSLHFAWYINLIISCNRMPTDGTPMPWLIDSTGPTWIYCRRWTEWKEKWMSSVLYGLMKKISQVTLYIE